MVIPSANRSKTSENNMNGDGFMREEADYSVIDLTATVVAAFVSNNAIPVAELPVLISSVHAAIAKSVNGGTTVDDEPEALKPAVSIKKSLTSDYIICLEDGKKFKSLKRHLAAHYDLTPDEYRAKWGLPADYPMVAPAYAEARSNLAKQMGLGQQRRRSK